MINKKKKHLVIMIVVFLCFIFLCSYINAKYKKNNLKIDNRVEANLKKSDIIETDNTNLIRKEEIKDNIFIDYKTGKEFEIESYRASSDFYDISKGDYIFSVYDKNGTLHYGYSLVGAYYNNEKDYIGMLYNSGITQEGSHWYNGRIYLDPPEGAKYVRVSIPDEDEDFLWQLDLKGKEYFSVLDDKVSSLHYDDSIVLNFGDSIFGNTQIVDKTCISRQIAKKTKTLVFDMGIGGAQISSLNNEWDSVAMYHLADCIVQNDYSDIEEAVERGWTRMPSYSLHTIRRLAHELDFNEVDVITISFGTNDYKEGNAIDSSENPYDTRTVCGGLRYTISKIKEKYPHIKIIVSTPVYRFFINDKNEYVDDGNNVSFGQGTLEEFANAIVATCEEMEVECIDLYHNSDIKYETKDKYFEEGDGTHPNAKGREVIADEISKSINKYLELKK